MEQERTTPDSLVVQPQMPPLLFESWAAAVLTNSAANGRATGSDGAATAANAAASAAAAPAARIRASLSQILDTVASSSGSLVDVEA